MFASPDQEPKCPWLRKRLSGLHSTMGSLCLFPALPSHPRPGRSTGNLTLALEVRGSIGSDRPFWALVALVQPQYRSAGSPGQVLLGDLQSSTGVQVRFAVNVR